MSNYFKLSLVFLSFLFLTSCESTAPEIQKPFSLNEEFRLESLDDIEYIGIQHNQVLGDLINSFNPDPSIETKQEGYNWINNYYDSQTKTSAKNNSDEDSEIAFFVDSPKLFERGHEVIANNELSELLATGMIETQELAEVNAILEYMLTNPNAQQMGEFGAQMEDRWNELRQNDNFNGMVMGTAIVICVHSAEFWTEYDESNFKLPQSKILPYIAADAAGAVLSVTYDVVVDGIAEGQDIPGSLLKGAVLASLGAALGVAKWVSKLF